MSALLNIAQFAYISFDVVPSAKGAATHIEAFTRILGQKFDTIELITISPTSEIIIYPPNSFGVHQVALPAVGSTLIHRVLYFRKQLQLHLQNRYYKIIHIRSIYEGFIIAINKEKYCQTLIFEVNGMPSIELKYRYPDIGTDRELMHKLLAQEKLCLKRSDIIITPASVTREYLISRQVSTEKIAVIPNGVYLSLFNHLAKIRDNFQSNPLKLLYFGTLARWQGVDLAVRAIALCQLQFNLELHIIGTATKSQLKAFHRLVNKLNLNQWVTYYPPLSQRELFEKMPIFDLIVAPLTLNDRNLQQGCCPLKVLEGMASGVPVITSDLQVVRDLGQHLQHFYLVKPNSVQAIADAIITLRNNPNLRREIGIKARKQIEKYYTWEQAGDSLISVYLNSVTSKQ